jgi:hypothetical protein
MDSVDEPNTADPRLWLIEAYLGALYAALGERIPGRERILWEVEVHLREAAAEALARGASLEAAQRAAIGRFGSAELVANEFLRSLGLPRVLDVRSGLSEPAVQALRSAVTLVLAPKDAHTAVLGYWTAGPSSDVDFGMLVLPSQGALPIDLAPIVFANVHRNEWWVTRVLHDLQPGLLLSAEAYQGELRLRYGPIQPHGSRERGAQRYFGRSMPPLLFRHLHLRGGAGTL